MDSGIPNELTDRAVSAIGPATGPAQLGRFSIKPIASLIPVLIAYSLLQGLGLAPAMQQAK
jgi:hypothetical protein